MTSKIICGVLAAMIALAAGSAAAQYPPATPAATGIPTDALSDPMAAVQQDRVGDVVLALPLTNATSEPLKVGLPALVEVSRQQGSAINLSTVRAKAPEIFCGVTATVDLPAGARCQVRITLAADAPGIYKARIAISDRAGGTSVAEASANVRRGVWCALGIAALGTILGIVLNFWSKTAKPQLLLLEQFHDVLIAWKAVDVRADALNLGPVTADVGQQIQALRRRLAKAGEGELKNLDARLAQLETWIDLEERARGHQANPGVATAAGALRTALKRLVNPTDDTAHATEIHEKLAAYDTAIDAAEAGGARRAARTGAVVARALPAAGPRIAPEDAKGLRTVLEGVVAVVTAVLVALSAIELVWLPNVAWGSVGDIITLFLGSVVAQAGALGVVDKFRERFAA